MALNLRRFTIGRALLSMPEDQAERLRKESRVLWVPCVVLLILGAVLGPFAMLIVAAKLASLLHPSRTVSLLLAIIFVGGMFVIQRALTRLAIDIGTKRILVASAATYLKERRQSES